MILALLLALATPGLAAAQTAMKSATWWNPDEGGWGVFTIDQGNVVAPGWFTYDSDGEPVWFLVPGATLQGDGSYKGDILRFTGVPGGVRTDSGGSWLAGASLTAPTATSRAATGPSARPSSARNSIVLPPA